MPGLGRSGYWWSRYHELRAKGMGEDEAAGTASLIEKRHKAKRLRNARKRARGK